MIRSKIVYIICYDPNLSMSYVTTQKCSFGTSRSSCVLPSVCLLKCSTTPEGITRLTSNLAHGNTIFYLRVSWRMSNIGLHLLVPQHKSSNIFTNNKTVGDYSQVHFGTSQTKALYECVLKCS